MGSTVYTPTQILMQRVGAGAVTFNEALSVFQDPAGTRYSGLHRPLRKYFYPKYVYDDVRTTAGAPIVSGSGNRCGRGRGTRVDLEVSALIRTGGRPDASHHKFTHKLFAALAALRLRPVAAQVLLAAPGMRVATFVDFICVETGPGADGRPVVCELKCGFDNYANLHTNHSLEPPFADRSDSPNHQHILQLLWAWWAVRAEYGVVPSARAYVFQINSAGARAVHLPGWATAQANAFYGRMLTRRVADRRPTRKKAPAAKMRAVPYAAPGRARGGAVTPRAVRPRGS
jgi:hypothetical protein